MYQAKTGSHLLETYPFIEILGNFGKFRPVFRAHFLKPASYLVKGRVNFIGPNTDLGIGWGRTLLH